MHNSNQLNDNGISDGEGFDGYRAVGAEYEEITQKAEEPHNISLVRGELTSSENEAKVPESLSLDQNYPNPFNPSTQISFEVPESGQVSLKIYNSMGQEVATLIDGQKNAGSHQVTFNTESLSSGSYIYHLEARGEVITRTMTFIR